MNPTYVYSRFNTVTTPECDIFSVTSWKYYCKMNDNRLNKSPFYTISSPHPEAGSLHRRYRYQTLPLTFSRRNYLKKCGTKANKSVKPVHFNILFILLRTDRVQQILCLCIQYKGVTTPNCNFS
jgi:hypothetical protein